MAFEAHVPAIAGIIQLALAPVFLLTAVGRASWILFVRLLIGDAFLRAFVRTDLSYTIGAILAVSTPAMCRGKINFAS